MGRRDRCFLDATLAPMPYVESFEPWIGDAPRALILGSMPGVKSLQRQCYYAHPRNAFWPILGELFGIEWSEDCAARRRQFERLPLVLWDVLQGCEREGSLDSAIVGDSIRPNAIPELLAEHSGIRRVLFNGGTAERLFHRHLADRIEPERRLEYLRLPSTSPAYAGMRFEDKRAAWAEAFSDSGFFRAGSLSIRIS